MKKIQKLVIFLNEQYGVQVTEDEVNVAYLLKNGRIIFNPNSRDETSLLFIISHLFGHIVQSLNCGKHEKAHEHFRNLKQIQDFENLKESIFLYELEAYRIGKGLLELVFGYEEIACLDSKLQIYINTDFEYFWNYLRTGTQLSRSEFNEILKKKYAEQINFYETLPSIAPPPPPEDASSSKFATIVY